MKRTRTNSEDENTRPEKKRFREGDLIALYFEFVKSLSYEIAKSVNDDEVWEKLCATLERIASCVSIPLPRPVRPVTTGCTTPLEAPVAPGGDDLFDDILFYLEAPVAPGGDDLLMF